MKFGGCIGLIEYARAERRARSIANGECGLSDGSRPGDWRLPTLDEWEAIYAPDCPSPQIIGATKGKCFAYSPWATYVGGKNGDYWLQAEQGEDLEGQFQRI